MKWKLKEKSKANIHLWKHHVEGAFLLCTPQQSHLKLLTREFFHRRACHGEKSWPLVFRREKMEYYLKILLPFWISEVPLRPVPVMCLGCGCGVPNSKVFDWRKMVLLCQELKRMSKGLLISDDRKIHVSLLINENCSVVFYIFLLCRNYVTASR